MTSVLAWPSHVIVVGEEREAIVRGRPSEFRRHGLHLTHVADAFEVLASLGREPAAAIVIPATLPVDLVHRLVETVRVLTGTRVFIGVRVGAEAGACADLLLRPDVGLVDLPLTPAKLSSALGVRELAHDEARTDITVGALVLNGSEHRVHWHGAPVHLGPRSFAVLELLMADAPRVVGVDEIRRRVSPGQGGEWQAMGVRSAIKAIRRQLRAAVPGAPVPLRVVYGVGYQILA